MSAPRIGFVIGGVQKGGTTALARFLGLHPGIALPRGKEAHVFDAPDYDEAWTAAQVDARCAQEFDPAPVDAVHGDATPIYCFHPAFVRRIQRYNPRMRWIVLLRDPVERAVSQYHMERGRGDETWPFWPAMLLERWRLSGHEEDFSLRSPLRHHAYRARGDYARQLDCLYSHFPQDQVLLLRNDAMAASPRDVVGAALRFLGLPVEDLPADADLGRVFEGHYAPLRRDGLRYRLLARLMADQREAARARYGLEW